MGWRLGGPAAAAVLLLASAHGAEDDARPLPFAHTSILPSGGTFYVEGRIRIPKGIEITVQKDSRIVARGNDAVIEVAGKLVIRGVADSVVPIENVTIEVQEEFESVRLDMTTIGGSSRGIVTPTGKACDGRIAVLNTEFKDKATLDVAMSANEVDLQRVYVRLPVCVRGVDTAGRPAGNRVKLNVLNCCTMSTSILPGALMGGLVVENVSDVTVRATRLSGDKASFTDCDSVTFDGNQVKCLTLEFVQTAAGRFGKSSMSNCDILCQKIVTSAPVVAGRTDVFSCDKCWFDDETDEKKVRARWFKDKAADPACGVTVKITKVMDRPLLLAGKIVK